MWNQFIVDWQNGNQRPIMVDSKEQEIIELKEELIELKEKLLEAKINNAKHVKVLTKTKVA